jgi:IS30 family transposase
MRAEGSSLAAIAAKTGRSRSTISRELRRNTAPGARYAPSQAQERARARKAAARKRPLLKNEWIKKNVHEGLEELRWSPQQISGRMGKEYPEQWERNISTEAVYNYLYSEEAPSHLREYLVREHKKRGAGDRRGRKKQKILYRVGFSARPAVVDTREEFGHWEGDTVVNAGSGSGGVHTELERMSRKLFALKVEDGRAVTTLEAQQKIFGPLPAGTRRSLTLDNGNEFALHYELHALDIDTYFADPYSPWQRGSNENANGLLRRFHPKSTNFNKEVTQEELDVSVELINNMPRKCLNWATANEVFDILSGKG